MLRVALFLCVLTGISVVALRADDATAKPRILVFTKTATFRHDSIPDGIKCVREVMAQDADVDQTEDSALFTKDNLAKYRAVVFL